MSDAAPCYRAKCDSFRCNQLCEEGQQHEQALHLVRRVRRHTIVPNAIAYDAEPQSQHTLRLLGAVQRHEIAPGAITYNADIRAYKVAGHLLRTKQRSTIVLDVITGGAAIGPCDMGQRGHQAVRLLCATQYHAIVPSAIASDAAVRACEVDQQHQQDLHLLRMVQRRTMVSNAMAYCARLAVPAGLKLYGRRSAILLCLA